MDTGQGGASPMKLIRVNTNKAMCVKEPTLAGAHSNELLTCDHGLDRCEPHHPLGHPIEGHVLQLKLLGGQRSGSGS